MQQDKRDDVWPDIVGYRDYRRELETNLESLEDEITAPSSYQASLPLGINLPKRGFTLRPGIMPLLEGRILYQVIADLLAPAYCLELAQRMADLFWPPVALKEHAYGRDEYLSL